MTDGDAIGLIVAAVTRVAPAKAKLVGPGSDLIADGVLDSLDVMSFLFDLEKRLGKKLTAIDETYSDFRVAKLVEIIKAAA